MPARLYILRLRSGQLYVGATTDLDRRWQEHLYGEASRTTRLDPPVGIAYAEEVSSFSEVRQREAQIKRWSRGTKEALVSGDAERLRWLAKSHDHRA